MSQKSKKDLFVEAVCQFNLSLIEVLLDDNKTYHDVPKEIFLQKMKILFEVFKSVECMDEYLVASQGVCDSCNCPNKGCNGFRFKGNHSNHFIDLIIEEIDGDIKDIYVCYEFNSDDKSFDKDDGTLLSLSIKEDETVNFVITPEFLANKQWVEKAEAEFKLFETELCTYEMLKNWHDKYAFLYNDLGGNIVFDSHTSITLFLKKYDDIKEIISFYEKYQINIKKMLDDSEYFITEQDEIDWVLKYEDIDVPYIIEHFLEKDMDTYKIEKYNLSIIWSEEFDIIDRFLQTNHNLHEDLYKKYCIFTKQEIFEKIADHDFPIEIFALTYHINLRKEYESIGIIMPLNVYTTNGFS